VQGVFFRAHMREKAEEAGVAGWVRNNPDGSVEAVLEGELPSVMRVVCWALRGPPLARVEKVVLEWQSYVGEFDRFEVLR